MLVRSSYKVGLVLDDTLDTPDGVQQYVLQLGSWLASVGHDVHYLVGQTRRTDIPNIHSLGRNVTVKFNGNKMSIPLPTSRRDLSELLEQQNFDVLHVQVPYSPLLAGRIIQLAPASTAIVGTFHILPYSGAVKLANRFLASLNHVTARRFDRLIAVSEPSRKFASRIYGFHNMQVVPNPVRLSQFESALSTSSDLNLVFLGRLVERKGVQYLLRAVRYIRQHDLTKLDFKLRVGGKGQLLPKLRDYVNKLQMADYVSFDGFINESDKSDYLAQADVAVFPSTGGESFGISLLEAMAAARGVVLAGNNPGYSAVMAPFSGQLFDPRDTASFAKILVQWLNDARARKLAAKAQKTYVQQFDVSQVGPMVVGVYEQALHKYNKP